MDWFYFIVGVSWVWFWVYWIMAAGNAVKNISPRGYAHRLSGAIIVALLFFSFYSVGSLGDLTFKHQPLLKAVGVVIFYAGLGLAVQARRRLGSSWSVPMGFQHNPRLVTSGPYKHLRHPIYTGLIMATLGSAILLSRAWVFIFLTAAIYFTYSAFKEEKMLSHQLPHEYPAYKQHTKMLIPYIF